MKILICGVVSAALFGFCLEGTAQADKGKKKRTVLKVATVAPKGTPWSELMDRFKRRAKKLTDGKIKVKVYYGGKLGGEKETIRETRDGRIHMWGGSTAAVATKRLRKRFFILLSCWAAKWSAIRCGSY